MALQGLTTHYFPSPISPRKQMKCSYRGSEAKEASEASKHSERSERSKLRRHALARASVSLGVGRTARGVLYFCRPLAWACRGLQAFGMGLHAPQATAGPGLDRRAPLFPQASADPRGDMAPRLRSLRSLLRSLRSLLSLARFARFRSLGRNSPCSCISFAFWGVFLLRPQAFRPYFRVVAGVGSGPIGKG